MSVVDSLGPHVADAFYGKFKCLRDAQVAAIAPLISGKNLVLSAGTGYGKTEAILAPLVSRYWKEAKEKDEIAILYIAPTKALINDLEKRLYTPLNKLGLRIGIRHGDRDDVKHAPPIHILLTTPESLDVLLFRNDPGLLSIRAVIIDEVHLLYNTQRGVQLSILLKRLQKKIQQKLQWAAISATVACLSDISLFLMGNIVNTELLAFPSYRKIDAQIRWVDDESKYINLIKKFTVGSPAKLLVFANSRKECERLSGILQHCENLKNSVFAHYSSLSKEVRLETEQKFAMKRVAVCIATSTLELGIDIGDIDVTLLWGIPKGVVSFLQRIGRGNRRVNKTNVLCLVPDTSKNKILDTFRFAALVDAAQKGEIPLTKPYDLFGAIGQQLLSILGSQEGKFVRIADLVEMTDHLSYVNRDLIESILAELADNGFIQRHGYKNQYGAGEELHKLIDLRLIYGNFGIGSQMIGLYHDSKYLGEVPIINLIKIRSKSKVRFAGKTWQVNKILRDKIQLKPSKSSNGVIDFSYPTKGYSTDTFIPNRIWSLLHSNELKKEIFTKLLQENVFTAKESLEREFSFYQVPFFVTNEGYKYFTFAGYYVNKAIALFTEKTNFEADDISILVPSPIEWEKLPCDPIDYKIIFEKLFEITSEQSIFQQKLPMQLQLIEFIQEWLKDHSINDVLLRLTKSKSKKIESTRTREIFN